MTSSTPRWSRHLSILGSYHSVGVVYPRPSPRSPPTLEFISVFLGMKIFVSSVVIHSVMVPKICDFTIRETLARFIPPSESAWESVFCMLMMGLALNETRETKYPIVPTQLDEICNRVLQC